MPAAFGQFDLPVGPTTSQSASQSDPLQIVQQLRNMIAANQVPSRMGGWLADLAAVTQLAQASPQMLSQLAAPGIGELGKQLSQMYKGIGARLGPFGGAQTEGAMGQAAGAAMPGAFGAFSGPQQQAMQAIGPMGEGPGMFMPSGQRSTSSSTTQRPFDPNEALQGWLGLGLLGSNLYHNWPWGGGGLGAGASYGEVGMGSTGPTLSMAF